jgi:diguanylate cyclase (GGDEF)-like protein/PAS domain S-box-containing protein
METKTRFALSPWRSLKVRATVFTVAIFALGIWALSLFVSRNLQADMEQLLGEQQFSVVTSVAKNVNDDLTERQQALETIAKEIDAAVLARPAALQTLLEQRPLLQLLFNGGAFVIDLSGTAIADVPREAQRLGVNYLNRDYLVAALKEGKPNISQPLMGKAAKAPVIAMTVPVYGAQGKVIGALIGATFLEKPNFLDKITHSAYGKSGGYLLVHAPSRQIITATDKKRIMELLPAPGVNRYVDHNIAGYEGYSVLVNALGETQLASVKQLTAAPWYVLLGLPVTEAFGPLQHRQQRLHWATIVLTVLIGLLTWLVLRRELAPLVVTANAMTALANSKEMSQPLPDTQQGEIGQLATGFNRILKTWSQREATLKNSEQNLAITLQSIGDAVIATDPTGCITRMNPTAERLCGWALADALGQPLTEVFRIVNAATREPVSDPVQRVLERGEVVGLANHTALLARDNREYQIADSAAPIRDATAQIVGVVLVFSDVTQKYLAEAALAQSQALFEGIFNSIPDAIVFANTEREITAINPAFVSVFGFEMSDLAGKKTAFFYESQVEYERQGQIRFNLTAAQQKLPYEVNYRKKDGSIFPGETLGTVIKTASGVVLGYLGVIRDITERNQSRALLLESEQRFRALYEKAPLPYQSLDIEANILEVNEAWLSMLGYTREEVVGRFIGDFLNESSIQTLSCEFPRFKQRGLVDGPEFDLLCKDGTLKRVVINGRIARDSEGNFQRTHCILTDITERKAAQEKLQLAASVFAHSREGITITDATGSILDVNDAFTRITGYSRDEVIGQNPRLLQSGRQDKSFYEAMWKALTLQGHWSGEVWNRRKGGEVYPELLTISAVRDAQGQTLRYVALFADISAIKAHESQLDRLAHFDALTNLPNRVLLADRLQQAMAQAQRRQQQVAVVYLDLDGFKAINDHHGHQIGDQVLITLAQRMKEALRDGDTLARMGGDEFVAVLIDLQDPSACVPLLQRLLAAAAEPVQVDELDLKVSASLGVTFYPQTQGIDADQLLRQADQAMYQAKVAGKNRYHVFDAAQDSSLRSHHESLERSRLALENKEFVLHYQPKVNMRTGQVIGAEALIRWQHPDKGLLAPALFLPVFEDDPLAVDVGEWVIDTALTQIEQWHATGLDLPVSVNIGARQLQQSNFFERLQTILARHPQMQPGCLELEVLETSALADMVQVSQVIEDCAEMGIRFALDDFGTGYSSLTYLKRLHVTLLKIDQSFVRDMLDDPDDLAILQGVIGLAAAFKREVIAEGVETIAHGTALLQLGCELAQGYGIARPMPADQLPGWVASWQPDAAWIALPRLGGLANGNEG